MTALSEATFQVVCAASALLACSGYCLWAGINIYQACCRQSWSSDQSGQRYADTALANGDQMMPSGKRLCLINPGASFAVSRSSDPRLAHASPGVRDRRPGSQRCRKATRVGLVLLQMRTLLLLSICIPWLRTQGCCLPQRPAQANQFSGAV